MIDIENLETDRLRFEVAKVDPKTTQIVRNVENFYASSLILIDKDGSLIYYNSRAAVLFELGDDFINDDLNIFDLLHYLAHRGDFGPGDPKSFTDVATEIINPENRGKGHFFQSYLTMPSSNILRILFYRNTDGTITLSAHDVSDQKRDENMLEMALDIGFAGYLIFDIVTNSCRVESRYLSNLLSYDELQTLETSGPSSLFHEDDLERSREMWDLVRSTGKSESATLRMQTENKGVRWFRFVLMLESDAPNCNRVVAFFNDITDTLSQEEDLRQAKRLAEESLASKENFLARMSHEVRTPMNAVIGMTDALINHHADPKITPQLELIMKSANSILKLLDETLTHSRQDTDSFSLDPAPANPADVVRDVAAMWEQQAINNEAAIRCIIKNDVPENIIFDKFRYEQCVNNLLSNAVKFTRGGKIDVILTVVKRENKTPYLVLAVRDTGIGMTPEQQSRIFEAYTQADESISSRFGGTGLGLNITKQIVERMGGTISIRSEIGVGSMFALSVPIIDVPKNVTGANQVELLTSPNSAGIESHASNSDKNSDVPGLINIEENQTTSTSMIDDMLIQAQPEATAYSALRILVVDDNPTNHLVIKSLLDSIVAEILIASNGAEALEVLDSQNIDIVLMDIHMPIMDGIECTLAIRSSNKPWKDVTIIALTADPQYQQKKLCLNIGMDEALAKPVRLSDLIEALDSVLPDKNEALKQDLQQQQQSLHFK